MTDMRKKLVEIQKALAAATTEEEKNRALDELARIGKSINNEDLKTIIACGCGPHGERGIESWPCIV
jgi:uncharacterized pyridoxal phosphate-containing UPF0001 family protein